MDATSSIFSSGSSSNSSTNGIRVLRDLNTSVSGLSQSSNSSTIDATPPAISGGSSNDFLPGCVLKLSHPAMSRTQSYRLYSYALYVGNGRVIHSWSSTRTNFRVRVDALRSLKHTGVDVVDATEEMDAFFGNMLGVPPLALGDIVARARQALHCETQDRRCSLVMIMHARYGHAATAMAESLVTIAPLVLKLHGLHSKFMSGEISLRQGLAIVLHQIDAKNYPMPPSIEGTVAGGGRVIPLRDTLRQLASRLHKAKGLLQSEIKPFLTAWIFLGLKASVPRDNGVAVVVAQLKHASASLLFSSETKAFSIVLNSNANLLERLVRERMECGICFVNYTDVSTKILECSHILCGICLASLRVRLCPYCREPITFERQIAAHHKAIASQIIEEEEKQTQEQLRLERHDSMIASDTSLPEANVNTRSVRQAIHALALAHVEPLGDSNDDGNQTAARLTEEEKRECAFMAKEDVHAAAV